jgi:phenylacetate-CoA ligase
MGGMILRPRSMMEATRDARRAEREGPEGISTRARERLSALVRHARANSPLFAELYREVPDSGFTLTDLPVTAKPGLMARFDEWVTDREVTLSSVGALIRDPSRIGEWFLGRYLVFTTSGTSGHPAIVLHDQASWHLLNALAWKRAMPGVLSPGDILRMVLRGARSAALFATGGHFGGVTMLERRHRDRPFRRRFSRVFSVFTPLDELVRELNAFDPALLGGYASALDLLAREQSAGHLRIRPLLVSSSGETLTPPMRERIGRAFGCRVLDNYSASEIVGISFQCPHGALHVNTDWFAFEPVDASYRPVPPGTLSHTVLVTNLCSYTQPILRYDLGDRVMVLPGPCPCGSPFPAIRVEGRSADLIVFEQEGRRAALLPLAIATVAEENPGVRRVQLVQTGPASLDVRVEAEPGSEPDTVWRAVRGALIEYLARNDASWVDVRRSAEPPGPDPRSGKFKQVLPYVPPAR